MNMRKLMAVVLAVVLAISAMAINVFAAEGEVVKIPLRPYGSYTTDSTSANYNFDVSVYGMFGFVNQNNYIELRLPSRGDFFVPTWATNAATVTWYASTNLGNKVKISPTYDNSGDEYSTVYVNFGFYEQGYMGDINGTTYWATLRQGTFGEITNITLTAEVKMPGHGNQWWNASISETDNKLKSNNMYMQLWTAGADGMKTYGDEAADERVTGSVIFDSTMAKSKTANSGFDNDFATFEFVSDLEGLDAEPGKNGWDNVNGRAMSKTLDTAIKDANGNEKTVLKNIDLVWDMTLTQRAYVINAESARVVVKLATDWSKAGAKGFTNGIAVYSLYVADTKMDSTDISQIWWDNGGSYNRTAKRVSFTTIDTTMDNVTELSFDVPVDKLYNPNYGISAGVASTFRIYPESETPAGNLWDNYKRNYDHWTNDAYLEITMPAVEEPGDDAMVDVGGDPTQSDTGDDTVDIDDEPTEPVTPDAPEEPVDTNPPTGIVLAVLPMVIAAAAVVASKRR